MNLIKVNGYSIKEQKLINECQQYLYSTDLYTHNIEVFKYLLSFSVSSEILCISLVMNTSYHFESQQMNNHLFDCENTINLKLENLEDNTYEDYRNLLVVMSRDFRIIILVLVNRLVLMQKYKKIDIEGKINYGYETLYVYAPIAHRLGFGDLKSKLEDLSLYFIDYNGYKQVANKLQMKERERYHLVKRLENEISTLLKNQFNDIKIKGRSKTIYSIYSKTIKNNKELDDLYDLQGIRIICASVTQCYTILGIIHHNYTPINGRFKDYIAVKKPNLYQSLHTAIIALDDKIFEIQIRTHKMDEIAEHGIASHWSYKSEENYSNNDIEEQLHLFRETLISHEDEQKSISDSVFGSMIYTFTPKKKIIILPKGSTVIDFAYRIHSNVAYEMTGAVVNNSIRSFDLPLSSGDVIKINTKKGFNAPNKNWLSMVKTAGAKKKIKYHLKKIADKEIKADSDRGRELFKQVINNNITFKKQEQLVKNFKCSSVNEFYYKFYNKSITVQDVSNYLNIEKETCKPILLGKKPQNKVSVRNVQGVKTEISNCCQPVYGDCIVGVVLSGRSIKVHRRECSNIFDTNKIIDVDFNFIKDAKYETTVNCKVDGQNGVDQIIKRVVKDNYAISQMSTKTIEQTMLVKLKMIVKDNIEVEKFMRVLMQEKDIISVFRNC